MKTRIVLVLAALLGVMLGREAQAYYNPSTGRWLSRDPIDEQGARLLTANTEKRQVPDGNYYAFVNNAPADHHDYLGLCKKIQAGPPGTISGSVILHKLGGKPVTATFALNCPPNRPYLMTWGLTASFMPYTGNDPFPGGWGGWANGGPGSYTITIAVASTTAVLDPNGLNAIYVVGCCTCSPYPIRRVDPPPPPTRPPRPPQPGSGTPTWPNEPL